MTRADAENVDDANDHGHVDEMLTMKVMIMTINIILPLMAGVICMIMMIVIITRKKITTKSTTRRVLNYLLFNGTDRGVGEQNSTT